MRKDDLSGIELLAPAGNMASALAAFDAGADAVYCGLKKFNARDRSENFTPQEMSKLIAYAHKNGKKVHITFNTLIKEPEIPAAAEELSMLADMGPDAVIVQDIGILAMIRDFFPSLTIHASTQMGFHNSAGLELASKTGAKRVILERQVTLDEINKMTDYGNKLPLELEVFVHGALCCCLSGSCLFSSWSGGWSGNRGKCKQPCRRQYFNVGDAGAGGNVHHAHAQVDEGAAAGAGLGHDFLRHIDRCRLLIHVVDVSGSEGRDPVEDFEAINQELRQYSPELASRKMIVAANKVDIMQDPELLQRLREHVQAQGLEFFEISAAAHQGTRELVKRAAQELQQLPPVMVYEPTYVERPPEVDTNGSVSIEKFDDTWVVEAPWLQQLIASVNFGDFESRNWFDQKLRQSGLFDKLEEMGIQDGDIVSLYDLEFEYQR